MKYLLPIIFLFLTACSSPSKSQSPFEAWQEAAQSNIRLLPKYGGVAKSPEQKAADDDLIKEYLGIFKTHRAASEGLIKLGFDYYYQNNIQVAMYRFNQAWLLDPGNENVFWGYGAVYSVLGARQQALNMYNEGLAMNPKNSQLLTDKATVYLAEYQDNTVKKDLETAIRLFKSSYDIDPKNQNTLYKLSVCYFTQNNCAEAKRYYDECKLLGGKPITKGYADEIAKRCK